MANARIIDDQVGQQWLQLIAQHSARVPLPVGLAMIVIALILRLRLPEPLVWAWLALVMLILYLRFRWLGSLPQNTKLSFAAKQKLVIVMSAINGTVHALCLLAFPWISDHEKLFITVLLLGFCTAATGTTAGHRATFMAYALPVLGLMGLMWAGTQNEVELSWVERSIGLLIGFYAITLIGVAKATHAIFLESWTIREKEHDLNQQLQQALEQAQQANFAKTRFLAAASHDLRQPLHTQSMLIATLSMRQLDARSTQIVQLLTESNATLAQLLDGLLDISKLDAGIVVSNQQQFRMQVLVSQHFAATEAAIRAKNLLPILICESDAIVETDPQLFMRILRNLTDNAIKFTERGQIQMAVQADAQFVYVSVRDTGPGILPQHFEHIFQEFYQIENPERDRTKGLGLGLSIVKRLTDLLGIGLSFTSSLHEGSKFTLKLPIVLQATLVAEVGQSAQSVETFSLTVLIVDDEKAVRTSVRILLEELGCTCMEAASTAEAVMLVQGNRPDFILADFRLRGDDSGIACITAIKNRWPQIKAVLVSGDTAPDRQREAHDAGIRLLHKPLSLAQLKQELNAVQASSSTLQRRESDHERRKTSD